MCVDVYPFCAYILECSSVCRIGVTPQTIATCGTALSRVRAQELEDAAAVVVDTTHSNRRISTLNALQLVASLSFSSPLFT